VPLEHDPHPQADADRAWFDVDQPDQQRAINNVKEGRAVRDAVSFRPGLSDRSG
jgi:hypothetical protein